MSISRNIYVGNYLKVWYPKTKYKRSIGKCDNGHTGTTAYCGFCGTAIKFSTAEKMLDIHELFIYLFGDENKFATAIATMKNNNHLDSDTEDYYYRVLPNQDDSPIGVWIDDWDCNEICIPPLYNLRQETDFSILINYLSKNKIPCQVHYGIAIWQD